MIERDTERTKICAFREKRKRERNKGKKTEGKKCRKEGMEE
jgi:hypothetical protein